MTDFRLTLTSAEKFRFCPMCGRKLKLDQSPDLLVRADDGDIDGDKSREAGFDFDTSLAHCGFHIRVWQAEDVYDEAVA